MRRIVRGVIVVAGIAFVLATTARVQLWTSEEALWEEAARRAPAKPRPWVNLGRQYAFDHQHARADAAYRQASVAAEHPDRPEYERMQGWALAQTNLAVLRAHQREPAQAMVLTQAVLQRYPESAQAFAVQTWLRITFLE